MAVHRFKHQHISFLALQKFAAVFLLDIRFLLQSFIISFKLYSRLTLLLCAEVIMDKIK